MKVLIGIFGLIWKLYVAIIFFLFAISFYPFFYVLNLNSVWKKKSFKLFVFWSYLMRIFCFYYIQKQCEYKLPKGPYIILSNHSSYLDIFMMHSIFHHFPFQFLGKGEILSYPIVRTYFKAMNIPVYRGDRSKSAKSYRQAVQALKDGWSLVIFPEGGIADDDLPQMMPFKNGAFKLAKQAQVPIVMVTFLDHFHLFTDPGKILGSAGPGVSRVVFHPIVEVSQINAMTLDELKHHCYQTIEQPLRDEGLL